MRKIIVGAFVSLDGVMQAPGGSTEDPTTPRSFKLTRSRISSTGLLIGHYDREGEIKIGDTAMPSPSAREMARQERMKRASSCPSRPRPSRRKVYWLGDRSSGAVSTYACFRSTRSSASWLPSEETALDWQWMAGGTVVMSGC